MERSSSGMALLHLYGQGSPHDEAWVVGNREGLLALKEALEQALEGGFGEHDAIASDGEGFSARVLLLSGPESCSRVAVPYHDPAWVEARPDACWPLELAPTQKLSSLK